MAHATKIRKRRKPGRLKKAWSSAGVALGSAGDVLDNAICAIAPTWGYRRIQSRALAKITRAHAAAALDGIDKLSSGFYEQAGNDRLRGDKWLSRELSPDASIREDLQTLRIHSRELYNEFPFAAGAIEGRTANVIADGMHPQSQVREHPGRITAEQAERFNAEAESVYKRWSPHACGKYCSFVDAEKQAHRNWKRDGECFIAMSDRPVADKPIPLHLTIVAPERVETPPEYFGDKNVKMGIRFDDEGFVEGYYVRDHDPNDPETADLGWSYLPASRVIHLFEKLWPGQVRGLPWLTPVMNIARDFKDWTEAEIVKAQVAANVTAIVSTNGGPLQAASGRQSPDQTAGGPRIEDMEPGTILYRDNVSKVDFLNPNQSATTFGMFAEWQLLAMAAGLNWPFAWLVKDYRRSSFSSGRLAEIDGGITIRCDQQILRSVFLSRIWHEVVRQGVLVGEITVSPTAYRANKWRFEEHRWSTPGRPWIDPVKEIMAAIAAKEHNIQTLAEIVGAQGGDYEDVLRQRGREVEMELKHKVAPPIKTGTAQKLTPVMTDDDGSDEERKDARVLRALMTLIGA